jgi:hypothetical protein
MLLSFSSIRDLFGGINVKRGTIDTVVPSVVGGKTGGWSFVVEKEAFE